MHSEGAPEIGREGLGGDERIARTCADALTEPIYGDHGDDRREAGGNEEPNLRDGREGVAGERDPLGAIGEVGYPSATDPHNGADPLVEAVDESVGDGGQAERARDVQREDSRDRLRRNIRQHTDNPERDHDRGDAHESGATAGLRRFLVVAVTQRYVHQWARQPATAAKLPSSV